MLTIRVNKNEHLTLFHAEQDGCTIPDFVTKWNEVKSLILSKAFENRDAISIIQLVDEDYFDAIGYDKKEIIDNDTTYLILSSTNWKSDILKDMMNYMEFELAKQWFIERKAEENVNETIQLVNDLQFTIENDTKLELFGCVEDGKEIVWLNPNFEYQSKVFEALNRLENMVSHKKNKDGHVAKASSSSCAGAKAATINYKISLPARGNNVVNIIDKTRGAVRHGRHAGEWILRVDKAHKGAQYPHININEAVSGIKDPHIAIGAAVENLNAVPPSSALKAAQGTARVLKTANKVLLPVAITIDTVRMVNAVRKDIKKGKPKNTIKTASSIAGGWGGGYGGAVGGAALGTAIFPGIGTIVGGIIGGISGGIGGSIAAEKLAETVVDEFIPSDDEKMD